MVSLYGSYDPALHSLGTAYPLAFPWNAGERGSKPRYFRDGGLWWRDPTARPTGRALVQCVGDLICEPRVGRAHCYGGQYFFHPLFQFVRPLLQMGDLNVGNLETTVSEATPYASAFNRLDANFTAEGIATLLNPWAPATARADIAWAKQQGADFVISYIHWGKSYVHFPTDAQRKQAQDLADAGADCIVGAHSHCPQAWKTRPFKRSPCRPASRRTGCSIFPPVGRQTLKSCSCAEKTVSLSSPKAPGMTATARW